MDNFTELLHKGLPWFWLVVMIVCIIIESLSLSLTTIWFALSALVMIFLSLTPIPFIVQLLIFVALSMVLLIFTRPVLKKKLNHKFVPTNYERILGQTATVTKTITPLEKGSIKINGMEWTAATKGNATIGQGSRCIIDSIEGVTAFVTEIQKEQ